MTRLKQRLPGYIAGWFMGLITVSVFYPVTIGLASKTLGIVLFLFLVFNAKHLTNAKR